MPIITFMQNGIHFYSLLINKGSFKDFYKNYPCLENVINKQRENSIKCTYKDLLRKKTKTLKKIIHNKDIIK